MRTILLGVAVLLSSCYQPRLPSGKFVCASQEECPTHMICAGGLCMDPAEVDLAGADLRTAGEGDLRGDPCTAGWVELAAQGVYGCRRSFSTSNGWGSLCRAGHHVCEVPRDATLLAQATAAIAGTCAAAGRFFAARIDVLISNTSSSPRQADANCMPTTGSGHALLGCGSDPELYALRSGGCSGLSQAASCSTEPSGWECSSNNGIANTVSYSGNQGGLLCCRD